MIPHQKRMVARLRAKPFALIGILGDGGRDALRKFVKENGITWRNVAERGASDPITARWMVHTWPTTYVLDGKGVIRYRDLRDRALVDAVVALLREVN